MKKKLILYPIIGIFLLVIFYFFQENIHEVCPFAIICVGPLTLNMQQIVFGIGLTLGIAVIVASIFFRRIFCGWFCPLGIMQRIANRINNLTIKKKLKLSEKTHLSLVIAKYILTAILFFFIFYTGKMLTAHYCPIHLLASIKSGILSYPALIITVLIFIISFFLERAFCKYACPFSSLMEIPMIFFDKIKHKKLIQRDPETCINCKLCEKICPMHIKITDYEKVNSHYCVSCRKCIEVCPPNKKGKNTLIYK